MLHDIQNTFMQAIYRRNNEFTHLLDDGQRTAQEQIAIYRNSIFGGILKSLAEIYPVTQRLVGETFFDALCMRYIALTPSHNPDINCYGQSLADFTADFPPAQSLPYLPDVMRLEWAWHWALQSESSSSQALQQLVAMDVDELMRITLVLQKTATLVRSSYPILAIWQVNQPDYQGDDEIDLSQGRQDLFVWRVAHELRIDPLTTAQADFVHAIALQQTLAQMQSLADFELHLIEMLQRGYIGNYQITPEN